MRAFLDKRARSGETAQRLTEIDQIEASNDAPGLKSRKIIEIAYSDWDVAEAADAKYPGHLTLDRVGEHVQSGYQASDPLSPGVFDKAAEATCIIRVKQVSEGSPSFVDENLTAYHNARNDLEAWRPYLADYDRAWRSCAYRFQFMQARYEKKLEKGKTVTMRDVGEKVGKASSEIGKWWSELTKPVTDAVDEFKAGYQSGQN
ncbi:hypothetical protein [Rhizobium mongolense]|uniref:Uncharacterized protein n=2 Tax=Rhizobium mongolense TaxID=57676 RepID=A0ABR6IJB4_9HYPH|nr:hypothetical protein [Rhizobium mongolense]MBB4227964.1 hypothetical protein [Rhizobium mongolense]TVZ64882.1 hypothetical protein BCL32_5155 [Rhizobium mongolense USDA 1844]